MVILGLTIKEVSKRCDIPVDKMSYYERVGVIPHGYYDSLKALLTHMIYMGLSSEERQKGIYFADSLEQIKDILEIV